MNFDAEKSVLDYPLIAFDTETSGPYPIESEIIELGAVKWHQGQVVDRFQVLLKPSKPLQPDNIRIHGITNEMVADGALMKNEIVKFCDFVEGGILMAHHAPFDLGFIALDIERAGLRFPSVIHLCTSLISRALLTTTNHKLQTLIKELQLEGGAAHRAYDDAYACLQVFFKSLEKLDPDRPAGSTPQSSIKRLQEIQKKDLHWDRYRVYSSQSQKILAMAKACEQQKMISIVYEGGQTKGTPRPIRPLGLVRNPDGDYVHAECGLDLRRKRFYLDKILDFDLL